MMARLPWKRNFRDTLFVTLSVESDGKASLARKRNFRDSLFVTSSAESDGKASLGRGTLRTLCS